MVPVCARVSTVVAPAGVTAPTTVMSSAATTAVAPLHNLVFIYLPLRIKSRPQITDQTRPFRAETGGHPRVQVRRSSEAPTVGGGVKAPGCRKSAAAAQRCPRLATVTTVVGRIDHKGGTTPVWPAEPSAGAAIDAAAGRA